MLGLLLREPRQQLLIARGRRGLEAERDRSGEGRVFVPIQLDEEVVATELVAVEAIADQAVLLDCDADAAVAGVDDVGACTDDAVAWNTSGQ